MVNIKQIIFLITLFYLGCKSLSNDFIIISTEWRSDSIGCKSLRQKIIKQDFEKLKLNIVGKSTDFAVKSLGEPNESFMDGGFFLFSYFVEPGVQCMKGIDEIIDVVV